ncbi:diguanylate cyclase [Marinomonas sp. A79]|uniref:diguanylate cyclase n=1 Tax=Marinomonas vulgaris TaxID=2823372 RepID=A0ABS5HCZ1_9GAMM|nr:diguanylate cyclase [Marinomonas vulgaris]MBR7888789.1 diguanylate cyclase [Marinomonas vulgaris]
MNNTLNESVSLEDVLDTTPIPVICSDAVTGQVQYVNKAFTDLFGFHLNEMATIDSWFVKVGSTAKFYPNVIEPWMSTGHQGASTEFLNATFFCKWYSQKHISMRFSLIGNTRIWYLHDVTDYWVAEERLRARSVMLEMVAKSSALPDILDVIVKQIQKENPMSLCSVLLFDKTNQCLRLGSGPSLPDFYNDAIDGIKVGLNVGSCGTAAHINERVIVENISIHPYWENFTELAKQAGLAACWSDPILSSKGELLGTFAIYKQVPSAPTEKDFELIQFASNLASIAIENFRTQEALENMAYFDHLTGLANRGSFFQQCETVLKDAIEKKAPLSVIMMDVDNFKRVNDQFGHKAGDLVLQKLAQTSLSILRRQDLMSRIGGEEFAVLLPLTEHEEALVIAERLRVAVEQSAVVDGKHQPIHYTVSFGVASKAGASCFVDRLLNRADKALYKAKAAGKNCVLSLDR